MKKNASLLILVMVLFVSCGGNVDNKKEVSHYYLEIVNESDFRDIIAVSLLGYHFSPLVIEKNGDAQTFTLSNGMIAGNENIFVSVQFYVSGSTGIKVNFEKGKTTVISTKNDRNEFGSKSVSLEVTYK